MREVLNNLLSLFRIGATPSREGPAPIPNGRTTFSSTHGALTVGRTVGEAFNWTHRLEVSCRAQLAAMACQTKFNAVPQEVLEATYMNYQPQTRRPYGLMEWPALLRKLDRLDPSYKF